MTSISLTVPALSSFFALCSFLHFSLSIFWDGMMIFYLNGEIWWILYFFLIIFVVPCAFRSMAILQFDHLQLKSIFWLCSVFELQLPRSDWFLFFSNFIHFLSDYLFHKIEIFHPLKLLNFIFFSLLQMNFIAICMPFDDQWR